MVCHLIPERKLLPRTPFKLAERSITSRAKKLVKMPETCQARNKLDPAFGAVSVEFHNLLRLKRCFIAPEFRHITEQVSMFNIELELVQLIKRHGIHHLFQVR